MPYKILFEPLVKRFININVINLITTIGSKSGVCDITFENEAAFKDHFLTTIHKIGSPSEGILGRQEKLQSQIF